MSATVRIFYTPNFLNSAFSTLRVFHTPRFPHFALRTPHSALLVFHLTCFTSTKFRGFEKKQKTNFVIFFHFVKSIVLFQGLHRGQTTYGDITLFFSFKLFIYLYILIFHSPHFLHSTFSTLHVFHTPHFLHSAFSTLRVFHTPRFPHSASSTLRTPHSAFSTPHSPLFSRGSYLHYRKSFNDFQEIVSGFSASI